MDFEQSAGGYRGSGGIGRGGRLESQLNEATRAGTLRYSNWLITLSTNVSPADEQEEVALIDWLVDKTQRMFHHWDVLNGQILKPAGSPNAEMRPFPADHKIIHIRSTVTIEHGDVKQHVGQIHAHVLLEVAHQYTRQEHGAEGLGADDPNKDNLGVHVNARGIRDFLNARIFEMEIDDDRKPARIYTNCRLLTKGTDLSNKFLTLQYIRKDTAKDGNGGWINLREQEREVGDDELSRIRDRFVHGGLQGRAEEHLTRPPHIRPSSPTPPPSWDDDIGLGGALNETHAFNNVPPSMVRTTIAPPAMVRTTAPKAPSMRKTTVAAPSMIRTTGPGRYK